jgi:hypothetical protein
MTKTMTMVMMITLVVAGISPQCMVCDQISNSLKLWKASLTSPAARCRVRRHSSASCCRCCFVEAVLELKYVGNGNLWANSNSNTGS